MLKLIDLDAQSKDADGHVFLLTVNGEKCGFTEQEVADLLRTKYGAAKGAAKKGAARGKSQSQNDSSQDAGDDVSLDGAMAASGAPAGESGVMLSMAAD